MAGVCLIHKLPNNEHHCLYCCLCFESLTPEQCTPNDNGELGDVCINCRNEEKIMRCRNTHTEHLVFIGGGTSIKSDKSVTEFFIHYCEKCKEYR